MQYSREDSVWRTLAVAFGDGLAFGVGMNLSRNAVMAGARANPQQQQPLADRLSAIENRIERARANGKLISPAALDARVTELSAQFERALAEHEVKVKIQLDGLQEREQQTAQDLTAQISALRSQMVTLHKEFAEAVSRLVDEQIE